MMLGSLNVAQSMCGSKTRGAAPFSATLTFNSLSTVMCIGWAQWAHSVSMSTDRYSWRNCPCTKGVAIASSAQAAFSRSPVLKVRRCGVLSAVTG